MSEREEALLARVERLRSQWRAADKSCVILSMQYEEAKKHRRDRREELERAQSDLAQERVSPQDPSLGARDGD